MHFQLRGSLGVRWTEHFDLCVPFQGKVFCFYSDAGCKRVLRSWGRPDSLVESRIILSLIGHGEVVVLEHWDVEGLEQERVGTCG